jgi:hypothetical protein
MPPPEEDQPITPLPGLPPAVQYSIRNKPSYEEYQPQWSGRLDPGEPLQPIDPQFSDIQRLFYNRIMRNAPTSGLTVDQFRQLYSGGTPI